MVQNLQVNAAALNVGRSWWLVLLFGIVSTLFGIMAILNPLGAGAGIAWALGVMALVEGVVGLIGVFKNDGSVPRSWMLVYALLSLVFGVLAVINPISMAASFVMVMGIWLIFAGVMRISFAVRVRKEIDNEWMLILSGVLAIILGGLVLFTPVAGLVLTVVWIGVGALVYGLLQIFAAFRLRKQVA
jgi:uncharacterized membrane protein HdeD (DUF308 family)